MTSPPMTPTDPTDPRADTLNQDCHCLTLDPGALAIALDAELGEPGLSALLRERCPHVFAAQPVFVAPTPLRRMAEVVQAIESVVALPAWREAVLADAPEAAQQDGVGARGVFFGHDFHLDLTGDAGPQLIEINTNAGGALLNTVLARAQRACCDTMVPMVPTRADSDAFEQAIVAMFHAEWARSGRAGTPLRTVAIVDEAPADQYLYAEFLLFRRLFERHGLQALIVDPADLDWRTGRLHAGDSAIDLVYNRLTDFYFEAPTSAALRAAWFAQAAVITPHPRAHALYADKRHLARLGDADALAALGVPPATRALLQAHVPRTEIVRPDRAEALWAARHGLFFKPAGGYGSRAAYRGDKLTRRVWDEIVGGTTAYVAQTLAPPGERRLDDDAGRPMKFDLRTYSYDAQVQWTAARLYQGQTTNFRTPGGGFAPVYRTPD
jgi:hypothetical protein